MEEVAVTADVVADHGLTPDEYDRTQKNFGSRPHDCCHPERSEGSAFRTGRRARVAFICVYPWFLNA